MDNFLKEELSIFLYDFLLTSLDGLPHNLTVILSSFLNSGRGASRIELVALLLLSVAMQV